VEEGSAAAPQKRANVFHVVESCIRDFLGTSVPKNVPLVSTGLDSISATELVRVLSDRLNTTLPATLFFDHPSLSAVTTFVESSSTVPDAGTSEGCPQVVETVPDTIK